ncbi:DUF3768 domain-containing protein [Telmatospirillum sp.]|uniref:DUF3768 domain-containing protein n=1 Tax=Telmatospirillum sp. TaxID=2079197 RepID=UPI0038692FF3
MLTYSAPAKRSKHPEHCTSPTCEVPPSSREVVEGGTNSCPPAHRIYYDRELLYGSEDPADASVTTRVLTILLPEDY